MRPVIAAALVLAAAALCFSAFLGCPAYEKFRCPDPIGEIVRQDCDQYRVRYESLKAKFSISFKGMSLSGEMGKDKLRDPSELLQLLMQQTLALCHDFNSCRVRSDEFTQRREEMDRTFTAVYAILDQLDKGGLPDRDKSVLVMKLVEILGGGAKNNGKGKPGRTAAKIKSLPRVMRDPFGFWPESKYIPCAKRDFEKDGPMLLDYRSHIERGKVTRLFLKLKGDLEEDDYIIVKAEDSGAEMTRCPVGISKLNRLARAVCRFDPARKPLSRARLMLLDGQTGVATDMGLISLSCKERMSRVWLAYQPEPLDMKFPDKERPWLIFFDRKKAGQVTARCRLGGESLKQPIIGSSAPFSFGTGIREYAIPLPLVLSHKKVGKVLEAPGGISLPADISCVLSLDGKQVKQVRFRLDSKARPGQAGGEMQAPHLWWRIGSFGLGAFVFP
ncbi:MAG: hypothetical protein GXP49_09755 [Deltaproteobacteria bacterium]|nr:hypothetical protein [Deltaproteobacteria bacterium]